MTVRTQFPLQYPIGWKRTQNPERSRFTSQSAYKESKDIERQLYLMGAGNVIISSNMQYRADGLPYARQNVSDTGVAVYFDLDGQQQCIPSDKWIKLEDNLRAVSKTIEAMRGIERWGAKDMMRAAFSGFKALPSAIVTEPPRSWWDVLEFDSDEVWDEETIRQRYRELSKRYHPDNSVTGDAEKFKKIKRAYEEGLETL